MLSIIAIAFGFVLIMSLHKHHCWHMYYPGHYTHYTNSVYALYSTCINLSDFREDATNKFLKYTEQREKHLDDIKVGLVLSFYIHIHIT